MRHPSRRLRRRPIKRNRHKSQPNRHLRRSRRQELTGSTPLGGRGIGPGDYDLFLAAYKTILESGLEKRVEQQRSDQEAMDLAADVCRLLNGGEDPARLRLVYSMGAIDENPTADMVRDYSAILLAAEETLCGHEDEF